MSSLNAFLKAATQPETIGTSAGGLGAVAAGMFLFPEPSSTILGGLMLLGLGIGGGLLGGAAARKGEELITDPKEMERRRKERQLLQQKHPYATHAGYFAPELATLRPSKTIIKSLLKGRVSPSKATRNAQMQVYGGAAIGGGIETARQLLTEGESFDPIKTGIATVAGSAMHKPYPWAKWMYPHLSGAAGGGRAKDVVPDLPPGLAEAREGLGLPQRPLTLPERKEAAKNFNVILKTLEKELLGDTASSKQPKLNLQAARKILRNLRPKQQEDLMKEIVANPVAQKYSLDELESLFPGDTVKVYKLVEIPNARDISGSADPVAPIVGEGPQQVLLHHEDAVDAMATYLRDTPAWPEEKRMNKDKARLRKQEQKREWEEGTAAIHNEWGIAEYEVPRSKIIADLYELGVMASKPIDATRKIRAGGKTYPAQVLTADALKYRRALVDLKGLQSTRIAYPRTRADQEILAFWNAKKQKGEAPEFDLEKVRAERDKTKPARGRTGWHRRVTKHTAPPYRATELEELHKNARKPRTPEQIGVDRKKAAIQKSKEFRKQRAAALQRFQDIITGKEVKKPGKVIPGYVKEETTLEKVETPYTPDAKLVPDLFSRLGNFLRTPSYTWDAATSLVKKFPLVRQLSSFAAKQRFQGRKAGPVYVVRRRIDPGDRIDVEKVVRHAVRQRIIKEIEEQKQFAKRAGYLPKDVVNSLDLDAEQIPAAILPDIKRIVAREEMLVAKEMENKEVLSQGLLDSFDTHGEINDLVFYNIDDAIDYILPQYALNRTPEEITKKLDELRHSIFEVAISPDDVKLDARALALTGAKVPGAGKLVVDTAIFNKDARFIKKADQPQHKPVREAVDSILKRAKQKDIAVANTTKAEFTTFLDVDSPEMLQLLKKMRSKGESVDHLRGNKDPRYAKYSDAIDFVESGRTVYKRQKLDPDVLDDFKVQSSKKTKVKTTVPAKKITFRTKLEASEKAPYQKYLTALKGRDLKSARALDRQYKGLFSRAREQEFINMGKNATILPKPVEALLDPDDTARIQMLNRVLEGKGFEPAQVTWDMKQVKPTVIEDFAGSTQKLSLGVAATEKSVAHEATYQWVRWISTNGSNKDKKLLLQLLKKYDFDNNPNKALRDVAELVADKTLARTVGLEASTAELVRHLRTKVKASFNRAVGDQELADLFAFRNVTDAPQVANIPFRGTAFSVKDANLVRKPTMMTRLYSLIAPATTNIERKFPGVGKQFEKFFELETALNGKLGGGYSLMVLKARKAGMSKPELMNSLTRINQYLDDLNLASDRNVGGKDRTSAIKLTAKEMDLLKGQQGILRQIGKIRNNTPGLRTGKLNWLHVPRGMGSHVTEIFQRGTDEARQGLLNDLRRYLTKQKLDKKEIDTIAEDLRKAIVNPQDLPPNVRFAALEKARGKGIPDSWVEKDPVKRIMKYITQATKAIAHAETFPDNSIWNRIGADPDVRATNRFIRGTATPGGDLFEAGSNLGKSISMGLTTGATDIYTGPFLGLQHNTLKTIATSYFNPVYWGRFFKDFKQLTDQSFLAGINKDNALAMEFMDTGLTALSRRVGGLRDFYNRVTFRQFFEKISRTLTFYHGKFLAQSYLAAANTGKKLPNTAQRFLEQMMPDEALARGYMHEDELFYAAARFTESVQGTYGPRGLPGWAVQSYGRALTTWPRWSIEKFNNFVKHVVKPAMGRDGPIDIMPLILMTAGAGVAGTGVQALREYMSGRKRRHPTWEEIARANKLNVEELYGIVGYKLLTIGEASGYAGVAMDYLAKGYESMKGLRGVDQVWFAEIPLLSIASENGRLATQFLQAWDRGEVAPDTVWDVVDEMFQNTAQNWRIGKARLVEMGMMPEEKEDIKRKEATRDLRMWRFLEDRPISPHLSIRANPFIKSTRNFKRAKGAEIMDAVLDIKQPSPGMMQMPNPYMPSLNSSPMQFLKYYSSRTSEDKNKVMKNYMNEMVQTEIRQAMFKQLYPFSSDPESYDVFGPEQAAKMDKAYQQHLNLNP